ncbi:MAG: hypothetical protein ABJD97_01520 [Betaproteobacteria bacterium]
MNRTLATQATPFALAALLTLAMLAGTNALAGHQYRVAAAQERHQAVAMDVQQLLDVAHRTAYA